MKKAINSFTWYFAGGRMHIRQFPSRLGKKFIVRDGSYTVFRDTRSDIHANNPVILVIHFRLRFIKSISPLHWLFQRACIVTTPFWSGLKGFKTKLWLVDNGSKDYLGIYDWRGFKEGQQYVSFLLPILRIFSVKNSIWHEIHEDQSLAVYLTEHELQ